jgi:hypothetical protein
MLDQLNLELVTDRPANDASSNEVGACPQTAKILPCLRGMAART